VRAQILAEIADPAERRAALGREEDRFAEIEPEVLREWRESITEIYEDTLLAMIWETYHEMQPDRPLVIIPMGGAFRDGIPATVKDAWFARRGYVPDCPEEKLIRQLWKELEREQSKVEAESRS